MMLADICRRWLSLAEVEDFDAFARALAVVRERRLASLRDAQRGKSWEYQPRDGACVFVLKGAGTTVKVEKADFRGWQVADAAGNWAPAKQKDIPGPAVQQLATLAKAGLEVTALEQDCARLPEAVREFQASLDAVLGAFETAWTAGRRQEAEEKLRGIQTYYEKHTAEARVLPRAARRRLLDAWRRWALERLAQATKPDEAAPAQEQLQAVHRRFRADVCAACPRDELVERSGPLIQALEQAREDNAPDTEAREQLAEFFRAHAEELEPVLRGQIAQLLACPATPDPPPPCPCKGCAEHASLLVPGRFAALLVEVRTGANREGIETAWQSAKTLLGQQAAQLVEFWPPLAERERDLQAAYDHAFTHNFRPESPEGVIASKDQSGVIVLKWRPCPGAEQYTILRRAKLADTTAKVLNTFPPLPNTNLVEYPDNLVEPDTAYCYWVVATNQSGDSEPAGPIEGVAPAPAIRVTAPTPEPPGSRGETLRVSREFQERADKAHADGELVSLAQFYGEAGQPAPHLEYLADCFGLAAGKRVMHWEERLGAVRQREDLTALEQELRQAQEVLNQLIDLPNRPRHHLKPLRDALATINGFRSNLNIGQRGIRFAARFQARLQRATQAANLAALRVELEEEELGSLGSLPALHEELAQTLAGAEQRVRWIEDFRSQAEATQTLDALPALRDALAAATPGVLAGLPGLVTELEQVLKQRHDELAKPPPPPPPPAAPAAPIKTHGGATEFAEKFRTATEAAENARDLAGLISQLDTARVGVLAQETKAQEELSGLLDIARQRVAFVTRFLVEVESAQAMEQVLQLERDLERFHGQTPLRSELRTRLAATLTAGRGRVEEGEMRLRRRIQEIASEAWRPADVAAVRNVLQDPAHARLLAGDAALQRELEQLLAQTERTVQEIQRFLPQLATLAKRAVSRLDLEIMRALNRQHQHLWAGRESLALEVERQADEALRRVVDFEHELLEKAERLAAAAELDALRELQAEPATDALLTGNPALKKQIEQLAERGRAQAGKVADSLARVRAAAARAQRAEDLEAVRQEVARHAEMSGTQPGQDEPARQLVEHAERQVAFLRKFAEAAAEAWEPFHLASLDQMLHEADAWRLPEGEWAVRAAAPALWTQAREQVAAITAFAEDCARARDAQDTADLRRRLKELVLPGAGPGVPARLEGLVTEADRRAKFATRLHELAVKARDSRRPNDLSALRSHWQQRPALDPPWQEELDEVMRAVESQVRPKSTGEELWNVLRPVFITVLVVGLAGAGYYFGRKYWPTTGPRIPVPTHPPESATREQPWTNSLGMKFVPVPVGRSDARLFSVWETRVGDFEAFATGARHEATAGMSTFTKDGHQLRGHTWKNPGFTQSTNHPACGVSWEDATNFCAWLTQLEHRLNFIPTNWAYRLPTDAEWSHAAGLGDREGSGLPSQKEGRVADAYPWGTTWPPAELDGNYAGEEVRREDWPAASPPIVGRRDAHPRTAPVGSFTTNRHGLHDLGGNVWEWCADWYDDSRSTRVTRGGAWSTSQPSQLLAGARGDVLPDTRNDFNGFRVVLAPAGTPSADPEEPAKNALPSSKKKRKALPRETRRTAPPHRAGLRRLRPAGNPR